MKEEYLDGVFTRMSQLLNELGTPLPSVSIIAKEDNDPYRILVSTLISLRTRDDVTLAASRRLFARARTISELKSLEKEELMDLIKPAGFYRRKAVTLKKIAEVIDEEYNGEIPSELEKLMSLPGVGIKTASLVLNLGFGIDAVCVDCHVHQIANRLGWVSTKSAEETEREMRRILPKRFWIPLNELLVRYGQHVCLPISPLCSKCCERDYCPKKGVAKSR